MNVSFIGIIIILIDFNEEELKQEYEENVVNYIFNSDIVYI